MASSGQWISHMKHVWHTSWRAIRGGAPATCSNTSVGQTRMQRLQRVHVSASINSIIELSSKSRSTKSRIPFDEYPTGYSWDLQQTQATVTVAPEHPPPLKAGSVVPLIVDVHDVSRVGLAVLLRREPWVARCLLAREATEAQALARDHRPDVAVLDISNAGPFVASMTATVREAHPGIEIVLTSRCAIELRSPPRQLGARAYVPPSDGGATVVDAVRAALVAHPEMSPTADSKSGRGPAAELSPRERELLLLISGGATNREIARTLHLGPDAVKKNASALYRKLGVRNRVEATRYASALFGPPVSGQTRSAAP